MVQNKTLIFKKVPEGFPVPGEHLTIEDRPADIDAAPEGGLVLEIQQASVDPYLRGRMRSPEKKSYSPPFDLDGPVLNSVIARVHKSAAAGFAEGDVVLAFTPIAEYAVVPDPAAASVRKIRNPHGLDLGLFLGPLGMPGLTAWSGLHKIGKPQAGETIFVSSAAGAVGQIVGQIAKREGLTVIGSVGSDEKLDFITKELGFDAGFNYKKEDPSDALARLAPKGIDIYFENVGGSHLEAALKAINTGGRIPVCGMIDGYNTPLEQQSGVKGLFQIISKQLTLVGFIVAKPGYGPAYAAEHQEKLGQWIADGSVKTKLAVWEGIDNAAEAFVGMLRGENFGKALIKIR